MTTRFPALLLAVASSGVLFTTPVLSQEIVVSSRTALVNEAARVSRQLDMRLANEAFPSHSEGFAIVRFTAGADGRAQGVRLHHGSGKHALDKSAVRAVSKLKHLEGLRAGIPEGTTIQANVVVAPNLAARDRIARKLKAYEAERMARAPGEKVIALTALGARTR